METTVKEASENVVKMRASVYEAERFKNELVNQKAKEMEHMAEKMDSLRGELDVANDNLMKLSNFKAIEGNRAQAEDQHVDLELTKKHVAFDPLV